LNLARPSDTPRVEISILPKRSPYADRVKAAARSAGVEFVPDDVATPADLARRVLVVDLTRAATVGKLDSRVIAITRRTDLECYDVVRPEDVGHRLERCIKNLIEVERLRARVANEQETIEILNQFGLSLSAVRDREELLELMLSNICTVLRADGGSIYLMDSGRLTFAVSQNDTINFRPARAGLSVDAKSMAGFVAMTGETLNIPDVYELDRALPYRPNFTFDQASNYRTRSALHVPMMGREGRCLGVLGLINRKRAPGIPLADFDSVLPFEESHAVLARSLASQAAVALENHRLYSEIRRLFDGFVSAAVEVIEARDPATAGHSSRVAEMTLKLARECHDADFKPFRFTRFSSKQLEELRYASVLHDFGKVGVPEKVLLKAEKLYPSEIRTIEYRFQLAALYATLQSKLTSEREEMLQERLRQLRRDMALVKRMSRPSSNIESRDYESLRAAVLRWQLPNVREPVLRARDVTRLCIPYGTLDDNERQAIQMHVTHTYTFLKAIPWTDEMRAVPDLAHAHHEKLDGSGYPRGLNADQIPMGAKLMTIVDIFDALTAGDRPYKPPLSVEVSYRILREMVDGGKIHGAAVELFFQKRLWEGVLRGRKVG